MDKHLPVSTVFFDLGYTLMYFNDDFRKKTSESYLVLANSLKRQGCAIDTVKFAERFETVITQYYHDREKDLVEKPVEGFIRQVLLEFGQDHQVKTKYRSAMDEMYAVTEHHWQLEDDAIPTLVALQKMGIRLGIISNAADVQDVQNLIDKHQIRNYFDVVVVSSDIGIRKPAPGIFTTALQRMNASAANSILVGDTLGADILGAHRAGMRGIWITRRSENPRNALMRNTIIPDAEISTLAELPAVISEWNR